jgi:hypothetical protein
MKVELKEESPRLRDIQYGSTFVYNGEPYIRCTAPVHAPRSSADLIVKLKCGSASWLSMDVYVEPLFGRFIED